MTMMRKYGMWTHHRLFFHPRQGPLLLPPSPQSVLQSPSKRYASTSLASIRLYRILLRQAQLLHSSNDDDDSNSNSSNKNDNEHPVLLQPPLYPHHYGRARVCTLPRKEAATRELLRLFVRWQQEDLNFKDNNDGDSENQIDKDVPDRVVLLRKWYRCVTKEDFEKKNHTIDHDGDDHEDNEQSLGLWATRRQVEEAIRKSFSASIDDSEDDSDGNDLLLGFQRLAIYASRALQDQEYLQGRTSVSTDLERGVRVVATSSCIGRVTGSPFGSDTKHRFAYRIRVENLPSVDDDNDDNSKSAVQLLGRTWRITEDTVPLSSSSSVDPVVVVNAPTTGAVGQLPVLREGELFEYMSGCELATPSGKMEGLLHMAHVHMDTRSAIVGDPVEALQPHVPKFEVPVKPFRLVVDERNETK